MAGNEEEEPTGEPTILGPVTASSTPLKPLPVLQPEQLKTSDAQSLVPPGATPETTEQRMSKIETMMETLTANMQVLMTTQASSVPANGAAASTAPKDFEPASPETEGTTKGETGHTTKGHGTTTASRKTTMRTDPDEDNTSVKSEVKSDTSNWKNKSWWKDWNWSDNNWPTTNWERPQNLNLKIPSWDGTEAKLKKYQHDVNLLMTSCNDATKPYLAGRLIQELTGRASDIMELVQENLEQYQTVTGPLDLIKFLKGKLGLTPFQEETKYFENYFLKIYRSRGMSLQDYDNEEETA